MPRRKSEVFCNKSQVTTGCTVLVTSLSRESGYSPLTQVAAVCSKLCHLQNKDVLFCCCLTLLLGRIRNRRGGGRGMKGIKKRKRGARKEKEEIHYSYLTLDDPFGY